MDEDPESLLLVSTLVEHIGYGPVTAAGFEQTDEWLKLRTAVPVPDMVMPDLGGGFHAECLMRSSVVVEHDPVADDTAGVLHSFEAVPVRALRGRLPIARLWTCLPLIWKIRCTAVQWP